MSEWTSPGKSRKSTASIAASAPKYTVPPVSSSSGRVSIGPLSPQPGRLSSTLRAEDDDALDADEHQQHQTDDDPRPRLLGAHERDDRLDGAVDEHADHRPQHVSR